MNERLRLVSHTTFVLISIKSSFHIRNSSSSQVDPENSGGQLHVFGLTQVPPFSQFGTQTAGNSQRSLNTKACVNFHKLRLIKSEGYASDALPSTDSP